MQQIRNLREETDRMQQARDQLVEDLRSFRSALQQEVDKKQADNRTDHIRSSRQLHRNNQNFVNGVRTFVKKLKDSSDSVREQILEERETVYAKEILERRREVEEMQKDIADVRLHNLSERAQMHNIWFKTI